MKPDDPKLEAAARALYARMGGSQGYAKNDKTGWNALSTTQRRPWLEDVRAVIRAYKENA